MSAASDCCRVVFNILSIHVFSERSGRDKRIERAVGVCRRVVSAFSYSWKKKRDLADAQETQTPRSQVGHRVTDKMGLTSEDGGANAGTGKGNQTGLIS